MNFFAEQSMIDGVRKPDLILTEIRDLKQKVQASNEISFLKQNERKFWQDLVDSNIRAGTIACLWCLKAQLIKKTSVAFNRWKLYAACKGFEYKNRELADMKASLDSRENDTVNNAISVLHKYRNNNNNTTLNDAPNPNYESSKILGKTNNGSMLQEIPDTRISNIANPIAHDPEIINNNDAESKRKYLLNLSYEIIERASNESSLQNFDGRGIRNDLSALVFDMQSSTPTNKFHQSGNNANKYANLLSDSTNHYQNSGAKASTKKRTECAQSQKLNFPVDLHSSNFHEDMSHLKFRHGEAGNYVRGLLSKRTGSPQHVQRKADNDLSKFDSFLVNNQRLEEFESSPTEGSNKSNVYATDNSFYPRTAETARRGFVSEMASRRSDSPSKGNPTYLLPTSSFQKKSAAKSKTNTPRQQTSHSRDRSSSANNDNHQNQRSKPNQHPHAQNYRMNFEEEKSHSHGAINNESEAGRKRSNSRDSSSQYSQMNVVDYYSRTHPTNPPYSQSNESQYLKALDYNDHHLNQDFYDFAPSEQYQTDPSLSQLANEQDSIPPPPPSNHRISKPSNLKPYVPEYSLDNGGFENTSYNREVKHNSSSRGKMEKAQKLLIYGTLHDVLDARRQWERNLRR